MIVVSNTSPITNLAAIGQLHLLNDLYSKLHIPEAVWNELNANGIPWPGRVEVASAPWVHRHFVRSLVRVETSRKNLDAGELESIALASELQADLIILDEKEARHVARSMGLSVIGVVGVLLDAKTQGYITTVQPYLDTLRAQAGFFMSAALYDLALQRSGEA